MELSEAQDDDIKVLADRSDTDGHECILCMLEYYKVHSVIELSKEQIKNERSIESTGRGMHPQNYSRTQAQDPRTYPRTSPRPHLQRATRVQ